jgi:hypothetical protein
MSVVRTPEDGPIRSMVVLGYQRSGTSLLAEIVHRWGAYAGPDELLAPADQFNPQGYWEHTPLLGLFRAIAEFADHPSPTITYFTIDQGCVRRAVDTPSLRQWGQRLIARMEEPCTPWMWKDPALACFLPYWLHLWKSPLFLITVRDPWDSAYSWQKMLLPGRDPTPAAVNAWLLQWQRCMTLILDNTRGSPRLFVEYERLLDRPHHEAGRIAGFLEAHLESPRSTGLDIGAMAGAVTQGYATHRGGARVAAQGEPTRVQERLYQRLQKLTRDRTIDPGAVGHPLPRGWIEQLRSQERQVLVELGIVHT